MQAGRGLLQQRLHWLAGFLYEAQRQRPASHGRRGGCHGIDWKPGTPTNKGKRAINARGSYQACVSSRPRSPRFPVSAYESPNTHAGGGVPLLLQPPPPPLVGASSSFLCLRAACATGASMARLFIHSLKRLKDEEEEERRHGRQSRSEATRSHPLDEAFLSRR
ncbi:hypothetical protein SETIT_2G133100v2 [Setaria italica]|uniref:Uncharacterized protein n=1 Tax=Setaria italica TaxID=4555 RepID=A0A368PYQ8_SETIT|nr:hypothetical protein SETIT_2G133100v2 [Setaria italica]